MTTTKKETNRLAITADTRPRRIKGLYAKQRKLAAELNDISVELSRYHVQHGQQIPSAILEMLITSLTYLAMFCEEQVADPSYESSTLNALKVAYSEVESLLRSLVEDAEIAKTETCDTFAA
jgi:hypothetical protein